MCSPYHLCTDKETDTTYTNVLWISNCSAHSEPMTSHAYAAASGGRTSWLGLNDTGIGLLGTGQYSQVLDSIVIGGYFLLFWHPIQYQSESSQHRPHASERLFSSAFDLYSDRRSHLSGHRADMLLFIKLTHCHHHKSFAIFRGHCELILIQYQ